MVIRMSVLAVCVAVIVMLNSQSATAQQPKSLPANPLIANPIDPASLDAPPAFGDSAPVEKKTAEIPVQELAPPESPAVAETEWKPKLRVVLVTKAARIDEPARLYRGGNAPLYFDGSQVPNTVNPTANNRMVVHAHPFAILMCDEVTMDAKASETGELAYSVSCKRKVILKIDDYTVTGDSITSGEGKLTITNAVVKSHKATLTAEKMQIQLPIFGVRVEPDAAEPSGSSDFLELIPDDAPNAFPPSARLETY